MGCGSGKLHLGSSIAQEHQTMTGLAATVLLQAALLTPAAQPYEEAFKDHENNGKPLLVLVGADWCPACVTMKTGTIARMERNGKLRRVAFSILNTDRDGKVAGKVMRGGSIPQLIMFTKNSKGEWERQQLNGAQSEQAVESLIDEAVARQAKVEKPAETTQASVRQ
jgi:thioredoxin-like negative regulator of GroEL